MVKGSLATDCIQRENECVEQCKAQSRSKWRGGKSTLRQKPLPSQCTSSQNSGGTWVLEQWPGGALYSPPQYVTTAGAGECTHRMHNMDKEHDLDAPEYLCCLSIYLKNTWRTSLEQKRWTKTTQQKLLQSYSRLWSKAQGNQEKSSRANHMQYPQLQCIWMSLTRK